MPVFRNSTIHMGTKVPLMGTDDIADKAVTTPKLADGSVTVEKLADGSVTNGKLAADAVDNAKIANDSISTEKLQDASVTNPKLATDAVTTDKIAAGHVQNRNIGSNAVTTDKVADLSVTTPKLADGSVTDAKMAAGTLTIDKFDPELRNAIKAATGLPEDLILMIQEVDKNLDTLNDTVFPITLGFSLAPINNATAINVNFSCSCKGEPFVPDTLSLTKRVDDSESVQVLADAPASSGSVSTPIEGVREVFTYTVAKEGRTGKSVSQTRYLFYYGGSAETCIDTAILQEFNRASATGVAFSPSITTKDGEYIWLVVPKYLTINKVTSSGFDVTLEAPQTIGLYKAYRTRNTLTANTWNLEIS